MVNLVSTVRSLGQFDSMNRTDLSLDQVTKSIIFFYNIFSGNLKIIKLKPLNPRLCDWFHIPDDVVPQHPTVSGLSIGSETWPLPRSSPPPCCGSSWCQGGRRGVSNCEGPVWIGDSPQQGRTVDVSHMRTFHEILQFWKLLSTPHTAPPIPPAHFVIDRNKTRNDKKISKIKLNRKLGT